MSNKLDQLLNEVRSDYLKMMEVEGKHPYLNAQLVLQRRLSLGGSDLAKLIANDPKLLASRAGGLILDTNEVDNPSIGAIVTANLMSAGMEGLMLLAVNRHWLEADESGKVQLDAEEVDLIPPFMGADYSQTQQEFMAARGPTKLSERFNAAEADFEAKLEESAHDAYHLSLQVAADYAIFTPDDLAPLILENPLLLGLRDDQLVSEELFDGDPPAGMILSAHLTEMLVQQLTERAIGLGALGRDSQGEPIFGDTEDDTPVLH